MSRNLQFLNTLIPSRPELTYDIEGSNDNENEEDDDDLSPMQVGSEEDDLRVDFKPFNVLVQQHLHTKPTESNSTKYIPY
jgi:hypothetical protein